MDLGIGLGLRLTWGASFLAEGHAKLFLLVAGQALAEVRGSVEVVDGTESASGVFAGWLGLVRAGHETMK